MDATEHWLAASTDHALLTLADPEYPQALLTTADPPAVLFAVGRLELLNRPAVAIVGSRNATQQGVANAEGFAAALARAGVTVVSGLALGIDAAAHRGALAAEGDASTIAVVGTGVDVIYPSSHRALTHEIRAQRRRGLRTAAAHAGDRAQLPAPQPPHRRPRQGRARRGGGAAVRLAHHGAPRRGGRPRSVRDSRLDPLAARRRAAIG